MLAEVTRILFALGLPWLTGALFVMALWQSRAPGYSACVLGLGFPLGMCGVATGYLVSGIWFAGLHFWPNAGIQALLASVFALLVLLRFQRKQVKHDVSGSLDEWRCLSSLWRWSLGLLAAWLAVRWTGIMVEVVHRPLFPWDAWAGYAVESKLWFFVPEAATTISEKPFLRGEDVWTGGTKHPPGVALFQLWFLQALGRWDEALMNIAWPFGLVSLGCLLYGFLRTNGTDLRISALVAVFVLTLPIVNSHATLAGYADLWIGILFLCSVGSVMLSFRLNHPPLLVLSILSTGGMILLKGTSVVWAAALLLAVMSCRVPFRRFVVVLILVVFVLGLVLWNYGMLIHIPMIGRIGFRDGVMIWPRISDSVQLIDLDALGSLIQHAFLIDNWHIFWYIALPAWIAGLWLLDVQSQEFMLFMTVTVCVGLLVLIVAITTFGESIVSGTRVNRLLLHIVPLVALLGGCVLARMQVAISNLTGADKCIETS